MSSYRVSLCILIALHVFNRFLDFIEFHVCRNSTIYPIQNQFNPFRTLRPYFSDIIFVLFSHLCLGLGSGSNQDCWFTSILHTTRNVRDVDEFLACTARTVFAGLVSMDRQYGLVVTKCKRFAPKPFYFI
jgi:hypothetical protein